MSVGCKHEDLSAALLNVLPNLLMQFKGDPVIVPELAGIPLFIIPVAFSLTQRTHDYVSLIKNLGETYLSSSNDPVLNIDAASLGSLCKGDHACVAESKAQLQKTAVDMCGSALEPVASDDSTIAKLALSLFGNCKLDLASVARPNQHSKHSTRSKRTTTLGSPLLTRRR